MKNEPPVARRWRRFWHPGWWLLALALAGCAWLGWREYDFRCAIREAKAAGFWWESREPFDAIRKDWRAAFHKETWTERYRMVILPDGTDLAAARPLLTRLQPTVLVAPGCPNAHLDALRGIPALRGLDLSGCTGLPNVDALRGLPALRRLDLSGCTGLLNVDALRGLPALQELCLHGCTGLPNVDALRGLPALRRLDLVGCTGLLNVDGFRGLPALRELYLNGCTGLQNVDGLRGLPALQVLHLHGCTALPASALRELQSALPKTDIHFPDGTNDPPAP